LRPSAGARIDQHLHGRAHALAQLGGRHFLGHAMKRARALSRTSAGKHAGMSLASAPFDGL
jgi:hypothetical protein